MKYSRLLNHFLLSLLVVVRNMTSFYLFYTSDFGQKRQGSTSVCNFLARLEHFALLLSQSRTLSSPVYGANLSSCASLKWLRKENKH